MKYAGLALGLWFSLAVSETHTRFIPADHPHFRVTGRMERLDSQVQFDWPGVYVEILFTGSYLALEMDRGTSDLNVFLDSQWVATVDLGEGMEVYPISHRLKKGEHHLLITKRNEGSPVTFKGIHIAEGETTYPVPWDERPQLMVIGNSFSVGFGNESDFRKCIMPQSLTNNYMAYGPMIARGVGADYHMITVSGRGIVRNYGAKPGEPHKTLPPIFERAVRARDKPWAMKDWIPDVIVVNLGTNDLSVGERVTQEEFTEGALDFLNYLRGQWPSADMIYLAPTSGPLQLYIGQLLDSMNKADTASPIIEVPYRVAKRGCGWHPTIDGHRSIANLLIPVVDSLLEERKTRVIPFREKTQPSPLTAFFSKSSSPESFGTWKLADKQGRLLGSSETPSNLSHNQSPLREPGVYVLQSADSAVALGVYLGGTVP